MLRKHQSLTVVTPIPGFIPRQLAINMLHSHREVITLNPLVVEFRPISAPRDAAADEYDSDWYEIVERRQIIPAKGKASSSMITFNGYFHDITFNGCFHNMPWGLQTHIKAPMNVELRSKYCIAGNQSGIEPPERCELGLQSLGVPTDGLYLREDIEVTCNIAILSFVKTQLKAASKEMVLRIIKKAEQLDAALLRAMMEDGKFQMPDFNGGSRLPAELPQHDHSARHEMP